MCMCIPVLPGTSVFGTHVPTIPLSPPYICMCVCLCVFVYVRVCCMIQLYTDDDVYMEDTSQRKEYVQNESGMMWFGSHNSMGIFDWEYDQVMPV